MGVLSSDTGLRGCLTDKRGALRCYHLLHSDQALEICPVEQITVLVILVEEMKDPP